MKASSLDQLRQQYRNAYRKWTPAEEQRLIQLFQAGKSIQKIAQILGRQSGAIRARLQKLGWLNEE